jgi:hypothetical protein
MKLDAIKECYHYYSGKASDLVRQIAFAGIGIIWIFKIDQSGTPILSHEFIMPIALLLAALFFDFFQYFYGSVLYDASYRWRESQKQKGNLKEDHNFKTWPKLLWPMDACFYLKSVLLIAAYVILAKHLYGKLFL